MRPRGSTLPELLAPARSLDSLEAAFDYGADAAYLGVGHLNLRAHSLNLSPSELHEALRLAHQRNKRVYVALNILPDDAALGEILDFLKKLAESSTYPDAFIVTDPGVLQQCRRYLPEVPLHLSTQAGTFNTSAMRFWAEQGVSRFILPRELTLEQIRTINAKNIAPTEVFVHGAMCVAISGRCLIGAYLAGRHPNFGDCPQYCRIPFEVRPIYDKSPSTPPEWMKLQQDDTQAYLFNSRDLNALPLLREILQTGVASLKIEGRNKSHHYIASVTSVYRAALDSYAASPQTFTVQQEWLDELQRLDHRPYTTGFFDQEISLQEVFGKKETGAVQIVGIVREITDQGDALVDVKYPFACNETLSVLRAPTRSAGQKKGSTPRGIVSPDGSSGSFLHRFSTICDCNGAPLEKALTNRIVRVAPGRPSLKRGDVIRKLLK